MLANRPSLPPNPCALPPARTVGYGNIQKQRLLRANVLATTRRLIAEDGADHFRLTHVADECGVSSQTIFNHFGSRNELLVSALREHISAMIDWAFSITEGPEVVIALARAYQNLAVSYPSFLRQMVLLLHASRAQLMPQLRQHAINGRLPALQRLKQQGFFRDQIDIQALCSQTARLGTSVIHEWAEHDDLGTLRREIIFGATVIMMGALNPVEVKRLGLSLV